MRRAAAASLLALLIACAAPRATLGPLDIAVPDGWRVTNAGGDNLQIADGTTAGDDGRSAGTARAVFDVYLRAELGPNVYAQRLRERGVIVRTTRRTIGGQAAVVLTYSGRAVAGRQEAVFFVDRGVQIVYRAAYRNDDDAYRDGYAAFREALASIRFAGRPARPA